MKSQTFADRLNTALNLRDMTAAELSRATNINEGTISCYRKGLYEAKQNRVYLIAKALRINEAWLMGYDVPMDKQEPSSSTKIPRGCIPLPETEVVPLLGKIACGEPILAEENWERQVRVPVEAHADFALTCNGWSMTGDRIQDGDTVYIRQCPEVEDGEIAAVLIGEEATLKHVYYERGKRITLKASNPAYADMIYEGETLNEVRILGKAVAFLSNIG